MSKVQRYYPIRVPYRKSLIYTRLGYEKTKTVLGRERMKQFDGWIQEAEQLCHITVAYKQMDIVKLSDNHIELLEGITIQSTQLARLLHNSSYVVFMAASGGARITTEIASLQSMGNMTKALVYDAAASVITDAGLDWLVSYIKQPLKRKARNLTPMRYSPGYGDLNISCQGIIYSLLEMEKQSIQITSRYMLIPEKTVTAMIGIEPAGVE